MPYLLVRVPFVGWIYVVVIVAGLIAGGVSGKAAGLDRSSSKLCSYSSSACSGVNEFTAGAYVSNKTSETVNNFMVCVRSVANL